MADEDEGLFHYPAEEPPQLPFGWGPGEGPEEGRYEIETRMDVQTPIVVTRAEWGAVPPKEQVPTVFPLTRVFFTKYTGSKGCESQESCTEVMRQMQKYHMETLGLDDIKYNFLIGGDGKVYEGRGWDYRSDKNLPFNPRFSDQRLDIAYIGDHRDDRSEEMRPPGIMRNAAVDLVLHGETEGYVEQAEMDAFSNTLPPAAGDSDFV